MAHFCKHCGKEYGGYPEIGFNFPHECRDMPQEERDTKIVMDDSGVLTVKHINHKNYYVKAIFPQLVEKTLDYWTFGVWVKIKKDTADKIENRKSGIVYEGGLHSVLPWHGKEMLGYPVKFQYLDEETGLVIVGVLPREGHMYNHFTNGLPDSIVSYLKSQIIEKNLANCVCQKEKKLNKEK